MLIFFLIQLQRFYLEKIFLPYGKGVSKIIDGHYSQKKWEILN